MRIAKLFITMAIAASATVAVADPKCNAQSGDSRFKSTAVKVAKASNGLPILNAPVGSTLSGNQ